MPTYEYQCSCGYVFEMMQSIKAKPLTKMRTPCESCGKNKPIKRLISKGGAIIFKGSGFYQTDYRSDGYKKQKDKETDKPKETNTSKKEDKKDV